MAYNRISDDEHDNDEEHGYIAIGEVRSEEDGQLASLTLFELGIPCEVAHVESEVDEVRRFLEGWHAGQQLLVRPQDAARALATVGPRLAPTQIWTDRTLYLEQLPTEHLLKLLDFRAIWLEPIPSAVEQVLAERGAIYPPDGSGSPSLPTIYLIVTACLGPLGSLMLGPGIHKTRRTEEGGTRPRYDEKTREKLEQSRKHGLITWCALYILLVVALKATIPTEAKREAKKNSVPAASTRP